ncbi:MAG: PKD domain-containing protein [Halopenitus sp.]
MKHRKLILTLLLVVSLLTAGAAATEEDAPLAEAGLDQSVTQGTTVYLDGGGSHAPDGEIVEYRWVVETPDGTQITPADPDAVRTTFEAEQLGVYEVTLTVTDDSGRTANDTLFVDVSRGEPPSVSVDGPNTTLVGGEETFNATIAPGDAAIEEVIWQVDGETVATFSDNQSSSELTRKFETLGTAEIAVTVVDEAGQRATATMSTDVVEPSNSTDTSGSTGSGDWYDGIAADADPVIEGPQIIDGEKPLEATHRISSTSTTQVESVTWLVDGAPVGEGLEYSTTWKPGEYKLSAVVRYQDGSKRIATFEDGSRDVVANPKPSVELKGLDGFDGSVSGTALATDEMGTLRSVSIWVDGVKVERWVGRGIDAKQIDFKRDGVADNEAHTVTVVATDSLGQERRVTKNVTPVGKPEIVSAEFVNEPVDSYHERIDPERYTAKYEVVVDLNGYSRQNIDISFKSLINKPVFKSMTTKSFHSSDKILFIFEVAYQVPSKYPAKTVIRLTDKPEEFAASSVENVLNVDPSSPEVRVNVHVKPEGPEYGQRRILLDASNSFDPDGTQLEFSWEPDSVKYSGENTKTDRQNIGKFTLSVRDQYKMVTTINRLMSNFYSPKIKSISIERGNNTYKPTEAVGISLVYKHHTADTEAFQRSSLKIEILGAEGNVIEWGNNPGANPSTTGRMEAFLKIPAAEFLDGEVPRVRIYNTKNPEQTSRVNVLPKPEITKTNEPFLSNVQVGNVEYLIRKPVYDTVTVDTLAKAKLMDKSDYHIRGEKTRTQYILEEYVQQEAVYEQKVEKFDTKAERDLFIRGAQQNWRSAGSETHTKTVTETKIEWRSSRGGEGQYTGESRRIETSPPEYRTEYQYKYEDTQYYTEYVDVTRLGTRTVTKERTRTVRSCTPFGCYKHQDSYTVTTTETYTYSVTVPRTRSKTITKTYWSTSQLAGDHRRTGATREKKVADAEHETQYKYQVERRYTTEITEYLATRTVQTQESINEWQIYQTVSSSSKVDFLTREKGIRLAGTKQESYWVLAEQTGSEKKWVKSVHNETETVSTRGKVQADVMTYEFDRRAKKSILRKQAIVETSLRNKGHLTKEEISDSLGGKILSEFCSQYTDEECN